MTQVSTSVPVRKPASAQPGAYVGRECIAPQINRNRNIGERGANMDRSVFRRFLSKMTWNSKMVNCLGQIPWTLHFTIPIISFILLEGPALSMLLIMSCSLRRIVESSGMLLYFVFRTACSAPEP